MHALVFDHYLTDLRPAPSDQDRVEGTFIGTHFSFTCNGTSEVDWICGGKKRDVIHRPAWYKRWASSLAFPTSTEEFSSRLPWRRQEKSFNKRV